MVVLTAPHFFDGEAHLLTRLFEAGMQRLHIRKPGGTVEELKGLLNRLPPSYYSRIVVHDHFELASNYPLAGIHLNRRNPAIPEGFEGSVSRSCHTIEELNQYAACDYLFLSPLFQSISKEGYGASFRISDLQEAAQRGDIHRRVFALGGIDKETIPLLKGCGFGGVALLGALWGATREALPDEEQIIQRYKEILSITTNCL